MQTASEDMGAKKQSLRVRDYIIYFLGYSILFAAAAAAVFVWFWLKRKRFVWQTDGVSQHYYGLLYFSRWGKEVIRQFQETHVLRFPTFSFRMGYGEDLFTTLAYYVIGDPFSLPAVFVPEQYLMHFHDLMLMVRFWLAGITFSAYTFYMGRRSRLGVLAGALIYIFNGFTMSGMRHHYFLNPFVFFPLILIGCERYFRRKKPGLFIFMVFLSAVSNFYFFYMLVIMTILYAVWRSVRLRGFRHFGRVILDGIAFFFYGIIGTLLASFIFLPVVLRFLQDPRTSDTKTIPLFWTESFYRNFIDCFLTNGTSALSESWTYMGFGAVAALCVLFIFAGRKKHFDLKAAFVGLTCLLMTPMAAYFMNGFSYPANRWMWAYALLVGYMVATAVPELMEAGRRQLTAAFVLMFILAAVCAAWSYTFSRASGQAFVLGLFALGAVLLGHVRLLENPAGRNGVFVRVQAFLLACVFLTIASAGYFDYSPERSAKVFEYLSRAQIETLTAKDSAAAAELIDNNLLKDKKDQVPFYRYTTYNPENNTSMLYGVSNTQYYWSLSNTSITTFLAETGQLNRMIHLYDSLDDRTALNELVGIRYFLGNDKEGVPYGYEKKEGLSYDNYDLWPELELVDRYSCQVYENKYALPFGFTSDRWISRKDYDAMDIPQRQQALMQGILLEREPADNFTKISPAESTDAGTPEVNAAAGNPAGNGASGAGNTITFSDRRIPVSFVFDPEKITASGLTATADAGTAGVQPGAKAAAAQNAAVKPATAAAQNAAGNPNPGTAAAQNTAANPGTAAGDKQGESAAADAGQTEQTQAAEAAGNVAETTMSASGKGERISFEIHEAGTVVSMKFNGLTACETGLYLKGMKYQPPEGQQSSTKFLLPVRGFSGEQMVTDKQFGFTTPLDPWTTGQTDFLINMRYHEQAMDRIELTFPSEGTFSFDSMEVVCQPMKDFAAQAGAFRKTTLANLDLHEMGNSCATDRITGQINLDSPKILCLQMPLTPGWTAYVDGTRAELLQADTMFSALLLPKGKHDLELRYQTPGLRLGAAVSLATLVVILLFGLIYTIVSLILRLGEKREEAIPEGSCEKAEETASQSTGGSAGQSTDDSAGGSIGANIDESTGGSTDQYSGQYSGQSAGVEAVRQVTDPETSSPERTSAFTPSGETGKDEHTAAPASSERVSAFIPSGEAGKDENAAAPASSERISAFTATPEEPNEARDESGKES